MDDGTLIKHRSDIVCDRGKYRATDELQTVVAAAAVVINEVIQIDQAQRVVDS